jgi:hypothetical protein
VLPIVEREEKREKRKIHREAGRRGGERWDRDRR